MVRQRLRTNKIAHHNYNPFIEDTDGQVYYHGIYEENNPEHVDGTLANMQAPKNLYAYNLSKGLHKEARIQNGPKKTAKMGGFMDKGS